MQPQNPVMPSMGPSQVPLTPQQPSVPPVPPTQPPMQPPMQPQPQLGQQPGFVSPMQQQPPAPTGQMQLNPAYTHDKLAIASLILGIVSLPASILSLLTLPIPVIGIILGAVSIRKNKAMAIAGIILSVIGVIASVIIFSVGWHLLNQQKNGGSSASKSTNAVITQNCYTFNLPGGLATSDQKKNTDCESVFINPSSSFDVAVVSSPVIGTVTSGNVDTYLKTAVTNLVNTAGGLTVTGDKFTSIDGQRAYEVTGTEVQGNYRHFGTLLTLSPKTYDSVTGDKLQVFEIVFDSASNVNALDAIVASWHWQ